MRLRGALYFHPVKSAGIMDVAGTIRAREGFVFNDGSTLNVNDKGVLTRTSADGTNTVATTSQNRIAKFSDNAGTVTDSLLNGAWDAHTQDGKMGMGWGRWGSVNIY